MNQQHDEDFDRLPKASLHDLKGRKIVKSVSVRKTDSGRYVAKIEDYYSNSIDILIGLKSTEHIYRKNEFLQDLEESAYIVLLDNTEKDFRVTTSAYASNGEVREIFGMTMTFNEEKELMIIKEALLQRGLQV